jgi:4a-hydroxytetrahydrobiopterin dehydratase
MAMSLADRSCLPCDGGVPPLGWPRIQALLRQLEPGWQMNARGHLERVFALPDFAQAMAFADRVGAVAEIQGHHPELHVAWGRCAVEIWTHAVNGLTENDFILAAKVDLAAAAESR